MKFSFSLDKLLRLRQIKLEACQAKLLSMEHELTKIRERYGLFKQAIEMEEDNFQEKIKKGMMAEQYSMTFEYIELLKAERKKQEHDIAVKQYELNKLRGEMVKLHKDKEIVVKLKEKEYAAWLKDELLKEQNALDEYAILTHGN